MTRSELERAVGRMVLDQGPNVIVAANLQGKVVYVNARFTALTGWSREEAVGRTLDELAGEAAKEPLTELWRRVRAGREWRGELVALTREGKEYWEFASVTPIRGVGGAIVLFLKVSEDITDRKRAYGELVKSEAKLRAIFEGSGMGMAIVGKEGRILEANDALTAMGGRSGVSLVGLPFVQLFHASEQPALEELFRALMCGERELFRCESRLSANDWANLTVSLARNLEGKPQFALAIVEDVTQRRRIEEELRAARDEAEKAAKARSEFLANMSHEIRTPIHAIIGNTELLLETELNEEQRDYSETVRLSADALLTIINDVLDISKIESKKLELECIDIDVCDVVEEAVGLVALQAHKKGLEIIMAYPDHFPHLVRGDPLRLRQVLVNLLNNAVKFTSGGEITATIVAVSGEAGDVVLKFSVKDTGLGIPLEKQKGLFQAFSQIDSSTTRRFGGTGLGLAICRRLVEAMGGEIGVESDAGKGSTFWFTARFASQGSSDRYAGVPRDFFDGFPVLVVDDNPSARSVLRACLESWGCRTAEASDGRQALALLRDRAGSPGAFSLALVDLRMPGIDGWQVASEVNSDPSINTTRLVLLTPFGLSAEEAKMKLLKWFDAYLAKPVKKSVLLEILYRVSGMEVELEVVEEPKEAVFPVGGKEERPVPSAKVLVAEDNEVNQQLFAAVLSKMGHAIDIVNDGKQAVEKVLAGRYDIIFMDVHMPVMNGLEATGAIRKAGVETPIIAVTASATKEEKDRCLDSGMDDFLPKPFRKRDLASLLARWFARRPPEDSAGVSKDSAGPEEADGVLDYPAALITFMGEEDVLRRVLSGFLERTRTKIPLLEAAFEKRDLKSLGFEAHALKGAALSLSAKELGQAAARMERSANDGDGEGSGKALADLTSAFHRLVELATARRILEDAAPR